MMTERQIEILLETATEEEVWRAFEEWEAQK